jgi:hypothetical protein
VPSRLRVALVLGGAMAAPALAGPGVVCTNPTSDLVHYWPGDGNAEDQVGTDDGTLSGALEFQNGFIEQAFAFDGVDDAVSFGTTAGNFGPTDFTVSYWIRSTNLSNLEGVLGKRESCMHGSFWDNRLNPSGTMNVELDEDTSATDHNSRTTSATMNDGKFHLLTFVREGTTLRIYVDGNLSATGTTADVTVISNGASLRAGISACTGADGTTRFSGQLDEIRIFDRALTPCEFLAGIDHGIDIDLDGSIQPLTDLLMLLRYAFGFRGSTLVTGALGNGCVRCTADALEVFIASLGSLLDVDGNGAVQPLTDGLLLLRYGFGFRGAPLVTNALAQNCTRCTAPLVENYLAPLF